MHKVFALVVAMLFCGIVGMPTAAAQSGVTASATINGHNVNGSDASDPVQLRPGQPADVAIELTNDGSRPVEVTQVELAGRVLGLNFFTYATTVDFTVQPGNRGTLHYQLDLTGLHGQATGLMGGQLTVKGTLGEQIATMPIVTDVRGSVLSVYGLFGIALFVLTVLALVDAAIGIARHRLSANRWGRGLRLLAPGIGVGLVLMFSASVARLWVADTVQWLLLAGVTAAVFFAIGYLAPVPGDDDADEDIDIDLLTDVDLLADPDVLTDADVFTDADQDIEDLTDGHTAKHRADELAK